MQELSDVFVLWVIAAVAVYHSNIEGILDGASSSVQEGWRVVPYENETWWQDVEGVAVIPVLYVQHRGETARQHKRMNIAAEGGR